MATLSFIPNDLIRGYLLECWGANPEVPVTSDGSYNITITNLTSGYQVFQTYSANGLPAIMDVSNFEILNDAIQSALSQFSGFCAFTILFGFSLIASLFSLHYLLNKWRNNASHIIVTGFTLLISTLNLAVFALRALALAKSIASVLCPVLHSSGFAFGLDSDLSAVEQSDSLGLPDTGTDVGLSLSLIPIFLWISDAFLLYRAWVIWVNHRKYTVIPALAFLASFVTGVTWLKQAASLVYNDGTQTLLGTDLEEFGLDRAVLRWVPALGFSCGLDALTTGMIAGRLLYHHQKQRKLIESSSTIYRPIVTIFIESAALSLISKILQLSIPSLEGNPIVVPLCTISSNLIVLRKVLGADVGQMLAKGNQDLSTLRFHRPSKGQANTNSDSMPGGFESHLIRTIGGHTIDIAPPEAAASEQSSLSNALKV